MVARQLHLRTPNELSDLIVLRHEISRGVQVLIPFPVPPLLAHELLEPAHSQLTVLHRPRELLRKIGRSNKRAQHSIRLRRHEKYSTQSAHTWRATHSVARSDNTRPGEDDSTPAGQHDCCIATIRIEGEESLLFGRQSTVFS